MIQQLSFNIAVDLVGILGMVFILFSIGSHFAPQTSKERRLCVLMTLFIGEALADLAVSLFFRRPSSTIPLNVAFTLKLILGNTLMVAFLFYLRSELELRNDQWRRGTIRYLIASAILGLLMLTNPWHSLFFRITDPPTINCHGKGFVILPIFTCPMLATCLNQVRIHREIHRQRRFTLGLFCLLNMGAMVVQPFADGFSVVNMMMLLSILVLSSNFYAEQNQKYTQQNLELETTRTALVLSQIQPHFLFNSMTAVMDLCDTNPLEAKAALQELSDYLHYKITALSANLLVDFSEDLEFLQNYLKLETRRFGARLKVEYDIETRDFQVPLLTLQPLAENAIRHGLSKKPGGGTLRILTREIGEYYSILVEDDGVGFLPADTRNASGNHVGLNSVRNRLAILCGGSLTVRSTPGVGTTVEITIRKKKKEVHHEDSCRR